MKQAVILAGGVGSRLGELVGNMPKPLLTVGDRPFLDHLVQEISRWGFERILILGGYHGDMIAALYDGITFNHVDISVVLEDEPLGTGGALVHALEYLDDYFMLFNGDSWIDYNLVDMMDLEPEGVHMLGRFSNTASRHETLEINKTSVKAMNPRGQFEHGFINAGVYAVNKEMISDFLPGDRKISFEDDVLPVIISDNKASVSFVTQRTYFIDIGIPDDYARAQTEIPAHRTRPALFIDRDNTLTYDREGYTHHPKDMEFKPGAIELIKHANNMGYYVFVVTNQGGVTKGEYAEHYVLDFHREMQYNLRKHGAHIDALEYEIGLDSPRRKPQPGMLLDLIQSWPIDLDKSIMIGDKAADAEAGFAAGIVGHQYIDGDIYEMFGEYIR